MPLVCSETSFEKTLGIKKERFDFLHHICGPDVHCFCPPGEKIIFLMMHNCSANWITLMMSQLNRIVWLVKIDVDRSSDFLTHVKYTHVVFSYNANFWLVYLLSDARFDWLLGNTVVQSMYWENIYQPCYKQTIFTFLCNVNGEFCLYYIGYFFACLHFLI